MCSEVSSNELELFYTITNGYDAQNSALSPLVKKVSTTPLGVRE